MVSRRRKRTATFWDPSSKKSCTITGWTFGLTMTATSQLPNRTWNVNVTDWGNPQRRVTFRGGGVALQVFSLSFLWQEHQLFHNFWSNSNDGFDLARYLGTTIYLPPHKNNTYVFWWDEDFNQLKRSDYWKCQPSLLLAYKNKRIIRPISAGNHKAQKVKIKPPATVSNQWRFQGSWMTMGLFMWGISIIDWDLPFSQRQEAQNPLGTINFQAWTVKGPSEYELRTFYYANWADPGTGNFVMAKTMSGPGLANKWPVTNDKPEPNTDRYMLRINEADDLPYWITMYGQNHNWNFDDPSDKYQQATGYTLVYWWDLNDGDLENQNFKGKYKKQWLLRPADMYKIAVSGPYVQRQNQYEVNIPILYKSKWQWGRATLNKQAIQPYIHFAPNQVAVRNPATIERSIITPWDTDGHGILTEEALQRFLRPSREVDARRPFTIQEESSDDEPYTSSAEESAPSEKDETWPEDQQRLASLIKRCRSRVQREQHERHRLKRFLSSLIKNPKQE